MKRQNEPICRSLTSRSCLGSEPLGSALKAGLPRVEETGRAQRIFHALARRLRAQGSNLNPGPPCTDYIVSRLGKADGHIQDKRSGLLRLESTARFPPLASGELLAE